MTVAKQFTQQLTASAGKQARIKGGNGGNCPGPSAPTPPPWWHLFVL